MSRAIFKIRIKDHKKTVLHCVEISLLNSVRYNCTVYIHQTGKVENFSTQQLPKNDVFFISFFNLGNDAFWSDVLKESDLHPVFSPTRLVK